MRSVSSPNKPSRETESSLATAGSIDICIRRRPASQVCTACCETLDPASGLVLPKQEKRLPRRILSVKEVEQVLALPDISTLQGLRDLALLELLWSTGMLRMEVAGLDQYTVDTSRKTVTIRQGKGKKDRVIPIGDRALKWVQHYQQQVRPQLVVNPEVEALFVALDGLAGLTPNGVTAVTKSDIVASGVNRWGSCHLFRHAMATQMLENGAYIRWIQAMLGHASLESTQIYTQVSIRVLQAVHASTHPAEQVDENE
ncbi:tyrosine recombinase XerD [Serratia sp. DD3]|nr:tyrosine recombinase XerD [Serratia sp. DD3]